MLLFCKGVFNQAEYERPNRPLLSLHAPASKGGLVPNQAGRYWPISRQKQPSVRRAPLPPGWAGDACSLPGRPSPAARGRPPPSWSSWMLLRYHRPRPCTPYGYVRKGLVHNMSKFRKMFTVLAFICSTLDAMVSETSTFQGYFTSCGFFYFAWKFPFSVFFLTYYPGHKRSVLNYSQRFQL